MAIVNEAEVIEISEDAYKQNTVYRPWKELSSSDVEAAPESVEVTSQWKAAK